MQLHFFLFFFFQDIEKFANSVTQFHLSDEISKFRTDVGLCSWVQRQASQEFVPGHVATVCHDSLPPDVIKVPVHENREQIPSTLAHQRPDNYRENDWWKAAKPLTPSWPLPPLRLSPASRSLVGDASFSNGTLKPRRNWITLHFVDWKQAAECFR